MMTEGQSVGGGLIFGDSGEDGETVKEVQGPGEWGREPGLLGRWRFTVKGDIPGVGGRVGSIFWGDGPKSASSSSWGGLDEWRLLICPSGAILGARRRRETLSGEDPDATALGSTSGGETLLRWSSLWPEESAALGLSPSCRGLWRLPPTITTLGPEPEAEPSAPWCSSSQASMDEVRRSICCTTWKTHGDLTDRKKAIENKRVLHPSKMLLPRPKKNKRSLYFYQKLHLCHFKNTFSSLLILLFSYLCLWFVFFPLLYWCRSPTHSYPSRPKQEKQKRHHANTITQLLPEQIRWIYFVEKNW